MSTFSKLNCLVGGVIISITWIVKSIYKELVKIVVHNISINELIKIQIDMILFKKSHQYSLLSFVQGI